MIVRRPGPSDNERGMFIWGESKAEGLSFREQRDREKGSILPGSGVPYMIGYEKNEKDSSNYGRVPLPDFWCVLCSFAFFFFDFGGDV